MKALVVTDFAYKGPKRSGRCAGQKKAASDNP
jgi:hypothetical protein